MHRRWLLVHRQSDQVRQRARGVRPADRPEPGRAVSDRQSLCEHRSRQPDALQGMRAVRRTSALRRASQHGEDAGRRCIVGSGQCLPAVSRRLRLRARVRRRAQVPRDAPVPGGADLDQPDSVVCGRTRARPAALVLIRRILMRPLDGITVITLEHAIAAPFCTRQLADLGARVIKIERPGVGGFARAYDDRVRGQASHFVWTNRSKESLTLDLKHEEAQHILAKLMVHADVLVQNLAPGAAARMGLSYETLHGKYPRLIVCDISGYGSDGPYRDKKAYDLLIQSESGFLSVTGTPDEPAKAGCSVADIAAGMYAYSNILAALIQRGKTGLGMHIDVSMLESMVEWMGYPLYYAFDGAAPPPRAGAAHATIYPYGPFPAGDGKIVMLGLQNEREWQVFCDKVLRQPDLASDPRFASNSARTAARRQLHAIIVEVFSKLTAEEVIARQRWTVVETPAGKIPALLPPGITGASGYAPRMGAVPALGEHTRIILEELGYESEAIDRLAGERAV